MVKFYFAFLVVLISFGTSNMFFAQSGNGDLTIVSTGGDAEGTTWSYLNGVIQTTSSSANVLNTVIQTKLNLANLSIEANKVTFSANITGSTSNSLSIRSKTHIVNTNATTITTQGGNVLFASNVDDATDGESTTNGFIQLRFGITINSNGGNITFGGGNTSGSDYAMGSSVEDYTEGVRVDAVIAMNSGGGNISIKGKSYPRAVQWGWGGSGVGFYFFSAATGTINSGTGTLVIDGYSQTTTSSFASGFYCMHNLTISSSNTSPNAITITGKATGSSGEAWGIESEGILSVLATGVGGGITINTSKQLVDNFELVLRAETNILAVSGPIQIKTGQLTGASNGYLYLNGHLYLGSKSGSSVSSSSSNINIQVDRFYYDNYALPKIATSGTITIQPNSTNFGQDIYTNYFDLNQNNHLMSGFTFGKIGNSGNLYLNTNFTVAGPVNVYGGYVQLSGTLTSSGTNDLFFKGIANSNGSVNISSGGITKTGGTGTLTLQANGRAINAGNILATGIGQINVILWSDYDGDNTGGGSTLSAGSISTNGGHVWLGGSNSNGGSYSWNGLLVGDGPSIGASGCNCHAIDLFSPITTNGGDVLLWAGNSSPTCGLSGIQSDGTRQINAGTGDITLISNQTGGAIELTSTGVVSMLPNAGSYTSALTFGGTLTTGNFTFNTSFYNGLKINGLSNCGLVLGAYSGHLNNGVAVAQGNTANVNVSSAIASKSLEIYGGAIALNENITTSGVNADMLIKAASNINLAASKTITTAGGDVNLWADSDDNATGYVQLLASAAINSNGGDINLGGGSSLTSDYAFGTTAETCPEVVGTQYISGIHLRQSSTLSSNGGNISLRGQNVNTSNSAMAFGISLRGVVINSGTGKIALNGVANGSGGVNAQAVASWGTLTLRSANTSFDAISISGNALSSVGSSSLGVNAVAQFEATGAGGGIIISGKSGVASTNSSVNLSGNILAVSGPISISGENASGTQDNIYFGSATTIGKKTGTNVTASSSNVSLEGNKINIAASVLVDCSGTLTIQPYGNSFSAAYTWPMANLTHVSSLTGLTIGKSSNLADVAISNSTSINGPITIYGGTIALNAALSATNTSTGDLSLNGTTLTGSSTITLPTGRTLTMNLSSNTTYAGSIVGTGLNLVKDGAGILALTASNTPTFANVTISGGTYRLNTNQQLTLSGVLTNNGTFTMRDGATLVQATSGTSITGSGTYNVQKFVSGNSATWNTTSSGRYWYMGVPMSSTTRNDFGAYNINSNRVWSYSEATKQYTHLTDNNAALNAGTGYVHRRATNDTITFTATGANGLYGADFSLTNLTRTSGVYSGYHLIANPYMAYLDWNAINKTNIEPTYYIRSNNAGVDISALISYNAGTNLYTNTSSVTTTAGQLQYLAPLQSIWIRVGAAATTGDLTMDRSMLSHQSGNPGLKNSTIFPTLARVNLQDGARFDQLLVFMNQDMSNAVDQYDSEKMFVSGASQIYTMAAGKKLVMNGLNSNKKKISVPLYLELPDSKVYNLQLAEYILEDGLILLEDKQEGIIQDFTITDTYSFYANSGVLQNRFVLHFYMPDNGITAQGPSNTWVEEETLINEGGNILVNTNGRGKVSILQDIDPSLSAKGTVVVRDAAGREVWTGQLSGSATLIELDTPSGIYFVEVELNGQVEMKKIFVQQ